MKIKAFVKKLNIELPTNLNSTISDLIDNEQFENDIKDVNSLFFIAKSINMLESEALSVENQIQIVNDVLSKLSINLKFQTRFIEI